MTTPSLGYRRQESRQTMRHLVSRAQRSNLSVHLARPNILQALNSTNDTGLADGTSAGSNFPAVNIASLMNSLTCRCYLVPRGDLNYALGAIPALDLPGME